LGKPAGRLHGEGNIRRGWEELRGGKFALADALLPSRKSSQKRGGKSSGKNASDVEVREAPLRREAKSPRQERGGAITKIEKGGGSMYGKGEKWFWENYCNSRRETMNGDEERT